MHPLTATGVTGSPLTSGEPLSKADHPCNGIKAMLSGSIASLGSQYVITLGAVNASTGDSLAQAQAQAGSKEQVLDALGKSGATLRAKLGESLTSIQKFDKPLAEATTSSLEALKAFTLGEAQHHITEELGSVPFLPACHRTRPQFRPFLRPFERSVFVYRGSRALRGKRKEGV